MRKVDTLLAQIIVSTQSQRSPNCMVLTQPLISPLICPNQIKVDFGVLIV